MLISLPYSKYK